MISLSSLAERLAYARKLEGMSQELLAERSGVRQGTIGNAESGRRKLPRELQAIADTLRVRSNWLRYGEGPRDRDLRAAVDHRLAEIGKTFEQLAIDAQLTEAQLAERLDNGKLSRIDMARIAPALGMQQAELENAAGGNIRMRPVDRSFGLGSGNASGGAESLSQRQTALLGLFDGLTAAQQDEVIRELEAQKQANETIVRELTARAAKA